MQRECHKNLSLNSKINSQYFDLYLCFVCASFLVPLTHSSARPSKWHVYVACQCIPNPLPPSGRGRRASGRVGSVERCTVWFSCPALMAAALHSLLDPDICRSSWVSTTWTVLPFPLPANPLKWGNITQHKRLIERGAWHAQARSVLKMAKKREKWRK